MSQQRCQSCGESYDERLPKCPFCAWDPRSEKEIVLTPKQEEQLSRQIWKRMTGRVSRWIAIGALVLGIGFYQIYRTTVATMKDLLVKRISQEFEEPRIQKTVQEVAATNAERLLLEQIRPEVENFKAEVESNVKETQGLIASAREQLDNLTLLIELEDAARYGSRKAFVALTELASRDNSLGIMALRRVKIILRELLIYHSVPKVHFSLEITTQDGIKKSADEFSTHELFNYLESPKVAKEHIPDMMVHIANKPKNEICMEARRIFETSDSLLACAATCGILKKVLGDKAKFLAFDEWIKVLNEEIKKNK